MPRIGIITDSSAYIPSDLVNKYDIKVAPLISIWGEEELEDGVDIMPDEFYARLEESDIHPKTSQATIRYFEDLFRPLVEQGTPILTIVISDKLSGTLSSAQQAKAMFPDATIELVNSNTTAMALGFQVLAAARAVEAGGSFEDVVELAKGAKDHTGVYFVVDTLEYLHRGGRIGGASKLFGSALNIKPILYVHEGQVESLDKVRTKGKAITSLLEILDEKLVGKPNLRISTLHAGVEQEAADLLELAQERWSPIEGYVTPVSPAIGTHVGPGTVGICYSTDL
jgi:DegV family protein with EDD domain